MKLVARDGLDEDPEKGPKLDEVDNLLDRRQNAKHERDARGAHLTDQCRLGPAPVSLAADMQKIARSTQKGGRHTRKSTMGAKANCVGIPFCRTCPISQKGCRAAAN